jgi:hypothetical protein
MSSRLASFVLHTIVLNDHLTVTLNVVLNRLRTQLQARGSTTIRGLGRTFRALDSYDGNRKVDAGEFLVGMQENGVKLTKAEADVSPFSNDR